VRRDQAETRNADQHVAASAEHRIAQDDGVNSGIKRRDLRLDLAQPVTGMALEQLDRQGLEAIESRRAIAHQVATGSDQFGQPVLDIGTHRSCDRLEKRSVTRQHQSIDAISLGEPSGRFGETPGLPWVHFDDLQSDRRETFLQHAVMSYGGNWVMTV